MPEALALNNPAQAWGGDRREQPLFKRSVGIGQGVRDSVSERRALKKQLIEPVLCHNLHVKRQSCITCFIIFNY